MCSAVTAQVVATTHQFLWHLIVNFWPWQWLLIVALVTGWTLIEIATRNSTTRKYSSENGFTPNFNRFVGTGTYAGFQGLFYLIATAIFGGWIYCLVWPFIIHYIIFRSTGRFLNIVGFWPRLENTNLRKKHYKKNYKKKHYR